MSADARIEQLERELAELRRLVAQLAPTPGLPDSNSRDSWQVRVGGETIGLRALTPVQWAQALHDLPEFLFAYAVSAERGKLDDAELLQRLTQTASQWILACALNPESIRIERLTIPEASEAIRIISALNGIDAVLGEMIQKKLLQSTRSTSAPDVTV